MRIETHHPGFLRCRRHRENRSHRVEATTNFLCMAGIALAGGALLTALALNGVFVCVTLIGAVAVLLDFRLGAVLLIQLMPF